MNLEDLAPELKDRLQACKTEEDVLKLLEEEGYNLSDDELEGIAGGFPGTCFQLFKKDK